MDYPKSVPNVGLVNGKFVDENTTTGQVGSLIPASWGNGVTTEILNVLKAASIVPDELNNDQLYKAINKIVAESGITKEDLNKKADKATTLAGYGINNAYTKDEANNKFMAPLGFPPVQQGTGIGQTSSAIKIGWSAGGQLKATADTTDLGHFWMSHNFNPSSKADASAVAQATEAARGTVMLAGFADVNAGDGFKAMTASMFMNFSLGFRQVWRDMLGSRAAGVGYLNSTGKPIMVSVISSTADRGLYIHVDGVVVSKQGQEGGTGSDFNCVQAIIPPGSTYAVGLLGGATISHWAELRA
ncbi:hypothetical protein [Pseudomonas sp. PH1b]|uniref:hypothetical protein n=1 Tax=Pseudomonas sp. PH1b TaxID=1397282 RepID=UPI00046965D4|nr:hypothetical protein [Pseudomonas sp. PH1b]